MGWVGVVPWTGLDWADQGWAKKRDRKGKKAASCGFPKAEKVHFGAGSDRTTFAISIPTQIAHSGTRSDDARARIRMPNSSGRSVQLVARRTSNSAQLRADHSQTKMYVISY